MIKGHERDAFIEGFKTAGYDDTHPVILDQDGKVIDGRNRLSVCEELGIEYAFETKDFADDEERMDFIIRTNMRRRHLTTSQRSMIAADMQNIVNGHNQHEEKVGGTIVPPTSTKEAADKMKVSVGSVTVSYTHLTLPTKCR